MANARFEWWLTMTLNKSKRPRQKRTQKNVPEENLDAFIPEILTQQRCTSISGRDQIVRVAIDQLTRLRICCANENDEGSRGRNEQ